MAVAATKMRAMQPLPLAPSGSSRVADGVACLEDAEGNGSVFLWGTAAWSWRACDQVARRLAADAFGVHENSLVRWRSSYRAGGLASLVAGPGAPEAGVDG